MTRKTARRRVRRERERLKTVNSKEAATAIKLLGREARDQMARRGRYAHNAAATITLCLGQIGVTPNTGGATGGHVRPQLRSALEDALTWVSNSEIELSAWGCKSSAQHEFCTSQVIFGPHLGEIARELVQISGWSNYYLGRQTVFYDDRKAAKEVRKIPERFRRLANLLASSSKFNPAPEAHPPRYERLQDGVLESDFKDDLQARIDRGYSLRLSMLKNTARLTELQEWSDKTAAMLTRCLSSETAQAFRRQTRGFQICKTPAIDKEALRSAYLELGLAYLEEVRERMPKYAEAAGQGPRVSITISGGTFNGSQIAAHIANINSTITSVHQHGDPDVASALAELTEAVLSLEEEDERRPELLENVEYLAQAANTPPEKRKSGVIKSIFTTLRTAAASASETGDTIIGLVGAVDKVDKFLS